MIMKKLVEQLAVKCLEAIEDAACNAYEFETIGCRASIELSNERFDVIEIDCDKNGELEIMISHKHSEYPNIEGAIADYIYKKIDLRETWFQNIGKYEDEECDNGLDPSFASWQDFNDYMYR
jgi:hypothetical protein